MSEGAYNMKNLLSIVLITLVGFVPSAFSQAPAKPKSVIRQQLNQLIVDYNRRFVGGKYISDKSSIRDFNLKQDAVASQLKQSGNLRKVLFITNDHEENLTVNLYALIDENNALTGLFYEKSYYFDEEERSYIRFSTIEALTQGLKFVAVNGTHALVVKGHYFTAAAGGTLQFNFLKDLKAKTWGAMNLFLINRTQGWALYNQSYQAITTASVTTWSSIFPPNGGVRDINVQ